MSKRSWLAGAAGVSLLMTGASVQAQQAPESAPQPAAQAALSCSGLGCIFGGQPQAAAQPAPAASQGPVQADPDDTPIKSAGAPKKAAKPVHVVTIAAGAPEVARLQRLAAALPKEKIKIVKTKADGDVPNTDFAMSTSLAAGQGNSTKLFTEEMHIVAGADVHSITDLRGKVVSFGPDKSSGQSAARKAFEALNVEVKETPLDVDNALDGLATGDVAAVVVLAPQPVDQLKKVSAPGAHLVAWPEGAPLPDGASATTIDANAYPALAKSGETIRAMGVEATLMLNAKGAKAGATKSFLKDLSEHSDALTKRGFDLLKADLDGRKGRHLASADRAQ